MKCFFQAEDGIRDLVGSRGLGDVYKRQGEVGGRNVADCSVAACVAVMRKVVVPVGREVLELSLIHI